MVHEHLRELAIRLQKVISSGESLDEALKQDLVSFGFDPTLNLNQLAADVAKALDRASRMGRLTGKN